MVWLRKRREGFLKWHLFSLSTSPASVSFCRTVLRFWSCSAGGGSHKQWHHPNNFGHLGGFCESQPSFSERRRGQMQVHMELYKTWEVPHTCEISAIFMERQLVLCISQMDCRELLCTLKICKQFIHIRQRGSSTQLYSTSFPSCAHNRWNPGRCIDFFNEASFRQAVQFWRDRSPCRKRQVLWCLAHWFDSRVRSHLMHQVVCTANVRRSRETVERCRGCVQRRRRRSCSQHRRSWGRRRRKDNVTYNADILSGH